MKRLERIDNILLILLLGSYDRETKRVLNIVKEEVAKYSAYSAEYIIPLLLEDIELYVMPREGIQIIVEKFNGKATAIILEDHELKNVMDFDARTIDDIESELKNLGYLYNSYSRLPVMEKLRWLARGSFLVFLIKHMELTRGGEYIELSFLLGSGELSPDRTYIFIKEGIELSTMLEELIDATKINLRIYKNEDHLAEGVRRILYHELMRKLRS